MSVCTRQAFAHPPVAPKKAMVGLTVVMDDIFGAGVEEVVVGILRGVAEGYFSQFGKFKGGTERRGRDSWTVLIMLATAGASGSLIYSCDIS